MNGGEHVARVLEAQGVRFLFTLCGGHIAPILVEAKRRGIRVVDVRHEATAVFAADAVARLTGVPGVAAVTAGPGVTNTVTALQNAALAESPLVLLGGATATLLKGRGALQDIDQMSLVRPLVKEALAVERVRELAPALERAFRVALEGVPGPVFVEVPVDLLYEDSLVKEWYGGKGGKGGRSGLGGKLLQAYLAFHARRLFAGAAKVEVGGRVEAEAPRPDPLDVRRAARLLRKAERPVLVAGSGVVADPAAAAEVAAVVEALGAPTYLAGMARGLLGAEHRLQLLHGRTPALKQADLVLLAGFPVDFRLDYGRKIAKKARIVAAGRDRALLERNRKPDVAAVADAGLFLRELGAALDRGKGGWRAPEAWGAWLETLRGRDGEREEEIARQAAEAAPPLNPLHLLREIEAGLPDDSVLVADGGDFVASASYIVRPRGPLRWLDPGPFGTLGVGAGFALGAALCRPGAEVWLLYGDGSAGYSLAEIDTFVRHGLAVIAVVGNDASWMQIAREQVEILGDDVGTVLRRTDYHRAAEGFGGRGFVIDGPEAVGEVLRAAREATAGGAPVVINAHLGTTQFRKGSISM